MFYKLGLQPHKVTLLSLLSAFTSHQYLTSGLYIHCCIVQVGLELDVIVATALVNMYSKCGSLEDAWVVFDLISDRDVILWTAIVTAYAKRGFLKEALEVFNSMLKADVTPDAVSFVNVLNACSSCPTFDLEHLHALITSAGLDTDFGVGIALLNLHVKRGNKTEARDLFNKLSKHNRMTWNSIISLYARLGNVNESSRLFHDMLQEGLIPDAITFVAIVQVFSSHSALANVRRIHVHVIAAELTANVILSTSLMNTYAKCNSARDALGMWEGIVNKNVVVWSAFIVVLTQLGLGQRAVESLYRMQEEGIVPNEVTYASLLEACTRQRLPTRGQQMHACFVGSEAVSNMTLVTVLINMYSTCGNLDQARAVFNYTEKKDVLLWTALISAHTLHNHGKVAAQLFNQMQEEGVLPNLVTFICVLDACSTLSALTFGKHLHARLGNKDVASKVDVGTALVNMYGKCGGLTCARGVFDAMPSKDRLSWTAIISAYAHNGDDRNTLKVFDQMIQQGVMPDRVTFLSIMCACSHSGLLDLGIHLFFCMNRDFGLEPLANHYDCLIDLLGRAGQLNVAEHMVNNMPAKPNGISWTTLLGASRNNIDVHKATLEPCQSAYNYDFTCTEEESCELLIRAKETAMEITDCRIMKAYLGLWDEYEQVLEEHMADLEGEAESDSGSNSSDLIRGDSPPSASLDTTALRKALSRLAGLELAINGKAMAAGLLKGLSRAAIRSAGKQIALQPGCLQVLLRFASLGAPIHVISANWSRDLVYGGLSTIPAHAKDSGDRS